PPADRHRARRGGGHGGPAGRQAPARCRRVAARAASAHRRAVHVRPLPRLHAVTDAAVRGLPDLGTRAAAIAAGGSAVALHARDRKATAADLAALADRFVTLTMPSEASAFVNGRPDIARAVGAQGVQLGKDDLVPDDVRGAFPGLLIGR